MRRSRGVLRMPLALALCIGTGLLGALLGGPPWRAPAMVVLAMPVLVFGVWLRRSWRGGRGRDG